MCGMHEQLDTKFREYETTFSDKKEVAEFPAKLLCGIIEVCNIALLFQEQMCVYTTPCQLHYLSLSSCKRLKTSNSAHSPIGIWLMQTAVAGAPEMDKVTLERLMEPLFLLAKSYEGGREGHACSIVQTLFDGYLLVEELFSENLQVISELT